ncbi:hypothetical protein NUK47_13650 [Aeromonas hydrophila]|uniref:hypothetical protein n=1 Tax=Aeromonas hydrophila TaxID=644 RepID=UPI00214D7DCD|nr:hypothetical protein [Aeromonas hydrophila]MCR3909817.1 hypothetical protein [Aeromonas hydrophila]
MEQKQNMKQIYNSLIIFDFFKEKFERDQFLIEFSVDATKKYENKIEKLTLFNEDLKLSLFLKQIIDVCSFLDEIKAFRSLGKNNEKIRVICARIKPAIKRIEEVKGLRHYRNALAAHNFRLDENKDEIILLSDYTKNPHCPNSIAEVFFLSALCTTIIDAINSEFKMELDVAKKEYLSRLSDDKNEPLRGIKNLREAYDEVDKYRIKLNLQPMFLVGEFEEFNIALKKLNWDSIPCGYGLSKDKFSENWCEVLGEYLRMRGYDNITYVQGKSASYTGSWLELYGHAVSVTDRVIIYNPCDIRNAYVSITHWSPSEEEKHLEKLQLAFDEIMKVVTP